MPPDEGAVADDSVHLKIRGGWAGLRVGANWGSGVLTYEGHERPFSLEGFSIRDLGTAGFTASGTVHDLRRSEDFNGRYENVRNAGTVVADGSRVSPMLPHARLLTGSDAVEI